MASSASFIAGRCSTGGRSALGTDIGEVVEQARTDLGSYYFLGFEPRREPDGAFHKLKVKLKGRGLEVRHRTGYVDKPGLAKVADRTTSALLLAHDDNPLGIQLVFGPPTPGPGERILTRGWRLANSMISQGSTPSRSQTIESSLAKAIFTSRYEFSTSLVISAAIALVSST